MPDLWSDDVFYLLAHVTGGQTNVSRSFRRLDASGTPVQWDADDLPSMLIPATTPISVPAVLDTVSGLISWVLTPAQSDAARAAIRMYWMQSGRRVGVVSVVD